MEKSMDINQYDDSRLVELKIPINLPYQTSWSSFERYDGEVTLNGTLYKYVKRKVFNDTLYLMCLPNTGKMKLESARNDFFMHSNDLAQGNASDKSNHSKTQNLKDLVKDFEGPSHSLALNVAETLMRTCWSELQGNHLVNTPHISPEQPPDYPLC